MILNVKVWIDDKVTKMKLSEFLGNLKNFQKFKNVYAQEYPLKNNEKVKVVIDGEFVFDNLRERQHIVSFSGGKDSTAMLIEMLERKMPIDKILFADTQYEFPEMYEYIDKVEKYIQKKYDKDLFIERTKPINELKERVTSNRVRGVNKGVKRGFPKAMIHCYWSNDSKAAPLHKITDGNYSYLGIAFDEKHRMSIHAEDMLTKYPLVEWGWTEEDCMNYLKEIDLVNPLYEKRTRTGCFWCPKQNLASKKALYFDHPLLWKQMKEWEKDWGSPVFYKPSMMELEDRFNKEGKTDSK